MRTILLMILSALLVFIFCQKKEKEAPTPEKPYVWNGGNTQVGETDWKVENSISPLDTDHVLLLSMKEKYDGYHEMYAMAIFSNEKTRMYKLVAPWYEDVKFDWSLVTSKEAVKVPFDSIPKERTDIWTCLDKMRQNRNSK